MTASRTQERPRSFLDRGRFGIWTPAFAGEIGSCVYRAKLTPPSTVTAEPIT